MKVNKMRSKARYEKLEMDLTITLMIICMESIDLSNRATLRTLKVLKILTDLKAEKAVPPVS